MDRSALETMTHRLEHRGPDEFGFHIEGPLGFGHRRLSIIDLHSGQQPMTTADGRITVTYNGEIYNFATIADELRQKGYHLKTRCDTEVILYAWAEWGEACVDKFRGMFAFALWDAGQKCLFLARDRIGIKPLYYAFLPSGDFIFGSELKALMAHSEFDRRIDPKAVEDYFAFGHIPDPRSIYLGARKLPPGHTLTLAAGGQSQPEARQYWDINFETVLSAGDDELGEELLARLKEAVELRMIADVPLGAFLSGGVDSSAVVALMSEISGAPVKTCSIGFDQADHDESAYAQIVADRYQSDHLMRKVSPDDFDLVDHLAGIYDEPFADSSALPTYRVCQLARERVTVALSGDGGDEIFAGYRRHRWHYNEERFRGMMPAGLRRPLFSALGALYPKMDWAPRILRAKATLEELACDPVEAYFRSLSIIRDDQRDKLFTPAMRSSLQGYHASEALATHMRGAPVDDDLARVQYADLKLYLPSDILTKVDRASMANSLEVRVPILDHVFLEWAAGLPLRMRLKGGQGKYLFKRSLESKLPKQLLYRPKMGFTVPLAAWFRGPLKEKVAALASSQALGDCGLLRPDYIKTLIDQHDRGSRDNSSILWASLMFESVLRRGL